MEFEDIWHVKKAQLGWSDNDETLPTTVPVWPTPIGERPVEPPPEEETIPCPTCSTCSTCGGTRRIKRPETHSI